MPHNHRPVIGLLINQTFSANGYQSSVWNGVLECAQEHDVSVIGFCGGILPHAGEESRPLLLFDRDVQRNVIYDLAGMENVDGLVIAAGALGHELTQVELQDFCDRFRPLSMATIAVALAGIPAVLVENYTGMKSVVTHLAQAHGRRRPTSWPTPAQPWPCPPTGRP